MEGIVVQIVVTAVLVFGLAVLRKYLKSSVQFILTGLAIIIGGIYGFVSPVAFVLPFDLPLPFFEWENQFWNPDGTRDVLWIIGLIIGKVLAIWVFIEMSSEDLDPFVGTDLASDRGDSWDRSSTVVWFVATLAVAASSGAFFVRLFV